MVRSAITKHSRFRTDADITPYLTTSDVALVLAIHPSTVKRWCNEGILAYDTTDGGHRRIALPDAMDVAELKGIETTLSSFTPHEPWVWAAFQAAIDEDDFTSSQSLMLEWIRADKPELAAEFFFALGVLPGISQLSFLDKAVTGLMKMVGDDWADGELRVGEEHFISHLVSETLLRLRHAWIDSPLKDRRTVNGHGKRRMAVVGAMEGNHHMLGPLCVRLGLELAGWRVHYLGGDVPLEEFSEAQRHLGAELVCVSFAPPMTSADVDRCVRVLRQILSDDRTYSLFLGGATSPSKRGLSTTSPFRRLAHCQSVRNLLDLLDESA